MSPICFGVNDILSQAMIKKPRWGYEWVKIDTISGRYYVCTGQLLSIVHIWGFLIDYIIIKNRLFHNAKFLAYVNYTS